MTGHGPATSQLVLVRSIHRFFWSADEETVALRDVSLTLAAGEMVALVGPSGSGKSTLLSIIAGADEPDGGEVHIAGTRISHRSEAERARLRGRLVGMLFQSGNLLPTLTVRDNIALAQRVGRTSRRSDIAMVLESLGLAAFATAYPRQLSGGELARAGLAVAAAAAPPLLLADEPTAELDERTEERVLDLLAAQARRGGAVLVAGHSPALTVAADRVVTLRDGRLVA